MTRAVILLGGGAGTRLGAGRPKAFVEVLGRSLLSRAVDAASAARVADVLLVVAPEGWEAAAERTASGSGLPFQVVSAGAERADSVRRAVEELPDAERVVCHDVARPLATPRLFREVADALAGVDGVVPVLPVTDTVKRVERGLVVGTLPRDDLVEAQTPQAFAREALLEAHAAAPVAASADAGVTSAATDEARLLQAAGYRVATVPGDPVNVKVTDPGDLALAEAMLRARDGG